MRNAFVRTLVDLAAASYQQAGRFAPRFARGKLTYDPIFAAILAQGLIPDGARILDLGCGQGLLLSWLTVARDCWAHGTWRPSWPPPPQIASYHGIEWMARDVERARRACPTATFTCGDIRTVPFGSATVVTIFDVLHYIDIESQDRILERLRTALAPDGLLLLRIGDASAGWPFHFSRWVDFAVTSIRGGRWQRLYCRSRQAWVARLNELGFEVTALPMSESTPFANVLLVAHLKAASAS
ncbi:MAG TPA: class I SAM-dependent methyltransferase [Acidiferrobacter sp.]|nr:class I SAM-dependent methyltransferase [Acidiferrobacter sp.]